MDDDELGRGSYVGGELALRDVHMVYESRQGPVTALEALSLSVRSGEFVSFIGPSGCGKSTCLRLMAGLLTPSSGECLLDGQRVARTTEGVGMVFQEPNLLPWKTALDNVLLPLRAQGKSRKEVVDVGQDVLGLVGLEEFAERYPHQLSGGMQQRIGVARALVTEPRVVLLDEPFGALDALTRETLNVELMRLWTLAHPTVVLVTHSINEAVFLSNRVFVLSSRPGRLLETIEVPGPFPRDLDWTKTADFGEVVGSVRDLLFGTRPPGGATG